MSRSFRHGRQQKKKHYGDEWWGWYRSEPKLWRHYHKHVKRRQNEREAEFAVMKGNLDVLFPLNTKPWIYYW